MAVAKTSHRLPEIYRLITQGLYNARSQSRFVKGLVSITSIGRSWERQDPRFHERLVPSPICHEKGRSKSPKIKNLRSSIAANTTIEERK